MATIEQSTCPRCGAAPGALRLVVGPRLAAQPVGTHSLAGVQLKVNARPIPVLCCAVCELRVEGRFDDDGRHVAFDPPTG
jgi:hypothetical protein